MPSYLERLFSPTFFRKRRVHFVFFVWRRATRQPIPTEENEYVKEHSLVKFPNLLNAKQAKVLNFRPDIT